MYRLTIEIKGEGAAFELDEPEGEVNVQEFTDIIKAALTRLDYSFFWEVLGNPIQAATIPLKDHNGNTCGYLGLDYI